VPQQCDLKLLLVCLPARTSEEIDDQPYQVQEHEPHHSPPSRTIVSRLKRSRSYRMGRGQPLQMLFPHATGLSGDATRLQHASTRPSSAPRDLS